MENLDKESAEQGVLRQQREEEVDKAMQRFCEDLLEAQVGAEEG